MNTSLHGLVALLTLTLGACGDAPDRPLAQPLSASAEQLALIPALDEGPYRVRATPPVDWRIGGRSLRVRVVSPEGDGPYPLVVFSHGFASDVDEYDALLRHWASHGYISVAPYHRDGGGTSRAIFNSLRYGNLGLIAERVADLHLILDHLTQLDAVEPGLATRIDVQRIAAAGHSFGAFSAQQLGGAVAVDPDDGARIDGSDPRIRAVVAISPPGRMFGVINEQSWRGLAVPALATTGTWDVDGRFVQHWREHALSWDTAPAGNNWLLVVDGADHYLGNLICRTGRDAPPQTDALRMVNATAVAFLDAFLRDQAAAHRYFDARPLATLTAGFARLERR